MIQKIKNLILVAILPLAMAAPAALISAPAYAATCVSGSGTGQNTTVEQGVNSGVNAGFTGNCNTNTNTNTDLSTLAAKVVNILSIIVGTVAVIMVIYGGFRYITSGGDSGNVSSAKNTLIYAIVGLVIVALAQFIVHFVLNNV